jgi:hypothetical protein
LYAYFFEVSDGEIYSVGLFESLIGDIVDGESLKFGMLYNWRSYKDCHRHKSISTVIKVKSCMLIVLFE